jgi:hypothetical protein
VEWGRDERLIVGTGCERVQGQSEQDGSRRGFGLRGRQRVG